MRAAICYEFGQPLLVEEVTLDPPQRGEVKIRVAATAICHSDVHYIRGEWAIKRPFIAGHESAGIVEEVGEGVTLVQPGDRVVVSLLRSCGRCEYCQSGIPQHCSAKWPLDTESRIRNKHGEPVKHGVRVGGFAEYAIVDQSQVVRLPEEINLETASLLACGVITGVGAVVNTARVEPGSTVVIIGAGGVGLNSVQGAALTGAGRIITVDVLGNKLEAARQFGATDVVNASQGDAVQAVLDLTAGRKVDYVIVTVGNDAAIQQGLQMVRPGGTVTLVGMPPEATRTSLGVRFFAFNGVRLLGSFMGATRLQIDVPRLIDHYLRGNLMLDELITARYPLDQINEAIESMERGEALRNVIVF
jgi:Zn-dependent alcohol dehydrogenase